MPADDVFSALADPTRRDIVEALARAGSGTATQLSSDMPITRQAVAKHLTHLRRANMVTLERRGRETHYRLTPRPFGEAMAWLERVSSRAGAPRRAA